MKLTTIGLAAGLACSGAAVWAQARADGGSRPASGSEAGQLPPGGSSSGASGMTGNAAGTTGRAKAPDNNPPSAHDTTGSMNNNNAPSTGSGNSGSSSNLGRH